MPNQPSEPGQKRVDPKHEMLSQTIVDMHLNVREINLKLAKQAKKFNFITPRDFLNFIK
jgi:dynein heavy chain 1